MDHSKILIYLLRRDLRVSDNPILHALSTQENHGFTHLLPLYIFPAQQVEVSGFISEKEHAPSPYPEARSRVASFWRCGPHRVKFAAESVWDVKEGLENVGSGLCIRVGMIGEVVQEMLRGINERNDASVGALWMVGEETVEEKRDESDVTAACLEADVPCKIWVDEKYLIDDRDLPFEHARDLPDIFTTYRKKVEPLREKPRPVLDTPKKDSLPPFPSDASIPAQHSPFSIPTTLEALQSALAKPLSTPFITHPPSYPKGAKSVHPFLGGETTALLRLNRTLSSGSMTSYKDTRNGLLGTDFSSKLSAWLALGCITARQIHSALLAFEDGDPSHEEWKKVEGYGKGENDGTAAMRFELLWRDYMRLCARKFGPKLFALGGFRDEPEERWNASYPTKEGVSLDIPYPVMIERLLNGTTGMGLIDASQREIFHTGYTSNRARQNVASFFAKKLNIDWRIGAEWYESILVDYDVASNWGNWQYLAGVGNDPRGEARIFNPVKQAFDYDPNGEYVKTWVQELRAEGLEPREIFQPWTVNERRREELGLTGLVGVEKPMVKIDFQIARGKGKGRGKNTQTNGDGYHGGRGGGSAPQGGNGYQPRNQDRGNGRGGGYQRGRYGGRGYGSTTGHLRGRGQSSWGFSGFGGGREARSGMMDKDREGRAEVVSSLDELKCEICFEKGLS